MKALSDKETSEALDEAIGMICSAYGAELIDFGLYDQMEDFLKRMGELEEDA